MQEPAVLPMVATPTAANNGADFVAKIVANTTSEEPGNRVADVNAAMKSVTRMGK